MNIVPIKIEFKTLYEHRYLYTDDSQYNSLIISNLINKNVILMDVHNYHALDDNIKQYVFDKNQRFNYVLSKDGLYRQKGVLHSYSLEFYYHWENITGMIPWTIYILTILNKE